MKRKISLYIQSAFYVFAGSNHFINPDFYLDLIPAYLPFHEGINWIAGIAEVLLGVGLLFQLTRTWSSYGIMAMLVAFIPSHIYFVQIGSCTDELCVPAWVGWFRLLAIHPLLLYWAWTHRK